MAIYKTSRGLINKTLSFDDTLIFPIKVDSRFISYRVNSDHLEAKSYGNDKIFELLGIKDKRTFVAECYGYESHSGLFPYSRHEDYEALTRIAIALFKLCEGEQDTNESVKESSPLYNVGDKVIIKSKYDTGCCDSDYPLFFATEMLENYGGKTVTISSVHRLTNTHILSAKLCKEPYYYHIKEDSNWMWDASMFSGKAVEILVKPKSTSSSKTSTTKKSTKTNKTIQSTMEKKSIFASFIDKYKAQFVPEKDDTLKISMDGNVCVPIDGEYVGIDKDDNLISYPKEACFDLPIYLLSKPFAQIQVGDIILVNKSYMKVLKKGTNGTLNCLTFSGYTRNKKEVKDFVLGQSFAKVVVNMFSNMQAAGFNPMMLAMCDGSMNVKDLLIMQIMQGGGGAQIGQMNPMLMMALMDKEGDSSILETMMMMQMMGGQFPNPFIPNDKK